MTSLIQLLFAVVVVVVVVVIAYEGDLHMCVCARTVKGRG